VFIFLGDIEQKDLMEGIHIGVVVGELQVIIHQDSVICDNREIHVDNLDLALRTAVLAMNCVVIGQAVQTSRIIKLQEKRWIELKGKLDNLEDIFKVGTISQRSELPIDNKIFRQDFIAGLKYANQAFEEVTFRLAIEDYTRSLDSDWDESLYHCQHCLECIKDYFGDWSSMRQKLNIMELELREVTDFSAQYIRHGASRSQLEALTVHEKNEKAKKAKTTCQNALTVFGTHLDSLGIKFSTLWQFPD
jgi:hypothetical protein